jgi:VanZ like family
LTLFPYKFEAATLLERVAAATEMPPAGEVVSNVLLFVPLGALLYRIGRRRVGQERHMLMLCGVAGLLLSLTIEFLQIFLPPRSPTVMDVVANSAGALFGAIGSRQWGTSVGSWLVAGRKRWSRAQLTYALVVVSVCGLMLAGLLQRQTRLDGWSREYPLQVGNEGTGYRDWKGRLFDFEITDAAATAAAVERFAHGNVGALPGDVIARYEFNGSAPYHDGAGKLPDLNWTAPIEASREIGVLLPGSPWLHTDAPITVLADRLVATNAFSVRVACANDLVDQTGPARIVSNSVDFSRRNLTIAQAGEDLIVRIRTPHTGRNGSRPELDVPQVFTEHGLRRDILVSYDGATLRAAVAGSGEVHQIALRPGSILAREIATSLHIQTDEHLPLDAMFFGLMSAAPALLIAWLRPAIRERLFVGIGWLVLFALLFEATLVLVSGKEVSWAAVGTNLLVGLSIMSVCVLAGTRQHATA